MDLLENNQVNLQNQFNLSLDDINDNCRQLWSHCNNENINSTLKNKEHINKVKKLNVQMEQNSHNFSQVL